MEDTFENQEKKGGNSEKVEELNNNKGERSMKRVRMNKEKETSLENDKPTYSSDENNTNNREVNYGDRNIRGEDAHDHNVKAKPPDPVSDESFNMEAAGSSNNKQERLCYGEQEKDSTKLEETKVTNAEEEKREKDEEEDIRENINQISGKGDLSPRHTKDLRTGRKITNIRNVRSTRSSSAKPHLCNDDGQAPILED